jgi:2-keto-3-deoxy-L-rhamnonate aldolase RhmA
MIHECVRRAFHDGPPATGIFVHLFAPPVVELIGRLDVDVAVIDMEHTAATVETVETMILATRSVDLKTMVRVPGEDPDTVRRVLDIGADGALLPRVTDAADLERRADAVFFAPEGERGTCSLTRAAGFTLGENHYRRSNEETLLAGLVELESAVEDIEAILATDRLDLVVLGPGDLAQSMGHSGDLEHPDVVAGLETAMDAAHAVNVPVAAYAVSPADAEAWVDRGADVILYSDVRLLRGALEEAVR